MGYVRTFDNMMQVSVHACVYTYMLDTNAGV